mmetsp:Transcript_7918/g.17602  ORF Transcript_7918/g.17602 Transcript_7918/m.17602 type:complete len:112 (+) Transcript_7918:93-428(+)
MHAEFVSNSGGLLILHTSHIWAPLLRWPLLVTGSDATAGGAGVAYCPVDVLLGVSRARYVPPDLYLNWRHVHASLHSRSGVLPDSAWSLSVSFSPRPPLQGLAASGSLRAV